MHVPTLLLACLPLLPALAWADSPRTLDAATAHASLHVRADLPARLDMACQPLDTDFDDVHAHGDRLCVLVLEQSGQVAVLGQWIQGTDATVGAPDTLGPEAPRPWLVQAE
ncbi:hypothetical protein [Alkalisalibacterium limincola]|uniref:DUF3019 domain-containing protein n=1 Tax=Alkalisalibacterium limincola TaxID=2699169 RepID=A0A5C8KX11_9GAMM|nr:hypothetical protein [Alkalisalibacterium limincola]TXK64899.1 hypothetical protein FU658_03465 [Alkalisalibacterium limincola]